MKPTEPLPLFHSWPILDAYHHLDLGRVHEGDEHVSPGADMFAFAEEMRSRHAIGRWECDLKDTRLTWSDEVYDLFGLPRGVNLARAETVKQYCEGSRATMERLRAYAIKHRRGFTLDAEIRRTDGTRRWMRLIAAPVCVGNKVVRLVGLKQPIVPRR